MTDRPRDDGHASPQGADGPTRDIRLPPLPPPPPTYHPLENEPTDRLSSPDAQDRQATLAFDAPAPVVAPSAPAPPVAAHAPRDQKWPWVLLVLLPLVIIVAAGLVLARLLGG